MIKVPNEEAVKAAVVGNVVEAAGVLLVIEVVGTGALVVGVAATGAGVAFTVVGAAFGFVTMTTMKSFSVRLYVPIGRASSKILPSDIRFE